MKKLIICLPLLAFFVSCDKKEETNSAFEQKLEEVLVNYSLIVYANYSDTYQDAVALKTAVDKLVSQPSETNMDAAREAWLKSRESYGQTEAFRFYGGPIDGEDGPEGQMNAWPLDESYIDYVVGGANGDDPNANSGLNIINSINKFPTISKELIGSLNEVDGEANISSGYHAIEFLLWGQDLSTGAGGGNRPYTDYLVDENATATNGARRGKYLQECTALLVDDLERLMNQWKESGDYRKLFLSKSEQNHSLEKIVSALGKLSKGELAGERIYVAWDLRSKENEHSCFSDNTHRDIVTNTLGIENVYLGKYKKVDGTSISGTSIYDLVAMKDLALADEIKAKMESSLTYAEAIQAPFDQEFLAEPGRTRIQNTFQSLRSQGDLIAAAAKALGFQFDPEDI
jgi:putative iron-regulated protein